MACEIIPVKLIHKYEILMLMRAFLLIAKLLYHTPAAFSIVYRLFGIRAMILPFNSSDCTTFYWLT